MGVYADSNGVFETNPWRRYVPKEYFVFGYDKGKVAKGSCHIIETSSKWNVCNDLYDAQCKEFFGKIVRDDVWLIS